MVSYIQNGNLVWMYLSLDEKRHAFYYWDSAHCENELREIHSFWKFTAYSNWTNLEIGLV